LNSVNDSIVFHGKLSRLYRLAKEGKIKTNLQGSHTRPCKFWTATKILSGIRNSIVIAHGPSGCAYGVKQSYKLTNSRNSGAPYEAVVSTNMDEKYVIYGGEKGLKGAIKEVDNKYHPDVIFIATSCATGIIGDNVDAVADKIKDEINAKIMPIHCEGFAGEYRSGFDLVFKQIVQGKKALNAVEIAKIADTLDVDPEKLLREEKKIYCEDNLSEKFINSFYNKDNFKLIYFIIEEYINMEEDLHEFKLSKKNTSGK